MKPWPRNTVIVFAARSKAVPYKTKVFAVAAFVVVAAVGFHLCERPVAVEIREFSSDGCSMFPDQSLINSDDWCRCCFEHDIAYWQGGTEEERMAADLALRQCVLESTGDEALAEMMYQGVRLGGSPYFYNWYRWGYGWNYERKYRPLSADEQTMVDRKLNEYFANNPSYPCEGSIDQVAK